MRPLCKKILFIKNNNYVLFIEDNMHTQFLPAKCMCSYSHYKDKVDISCTQSAFSFDDARSSSVHKFITSKLYELNSKPEFIVYVEINFRKVHSKVKDNADSVLFAHLMTTLSRRIQFDIRYNLRSTKFRYYHTANVYLNAFITSL